MKGVFHTDFDLQFWIQMSVYAISFGVMYGSFKTKLDYLEKNGQTQPITRQNGSCGAKC